MKLTSDNPRCHLCESDAVIELQDKFNDKKYLYCRAHKPDLWPGKQPHLKILRYRPEPDSSMTRLLAMAESSPEHESFREEMCDLLILGGEGACRYYLSKLTGSDQFSLWDNEFLENVREYLTTSTDGAASIFSIDASNVGNLVAYFKYALATSRCPAEVTPTPQERAVMLLLHHPTWSEEQIAQNVPTTVKQLKRNRDFVSLRSAMVSRGDA